MNNTVQTGEACCAYLHQFLARFRDMYRTYKAATDEASKQQMGRILIQTVGNLRDGPWMHEAFLRSRANAVGPLICRSIQEKRACLTLLKALKEILERPRPVDQIAGLLQIQGPSVGGKSRRSCRSQRQRKTRRRQRGRGLCGSKACPAPQHPTPHPQSFEEEWAEFERLQKQTATTNMGILRSTKPKSTTGTTNKNLKELEDLMLELELLNLE